MDTLFKHAYCVSELPKDNMGSSIKLVSLTFKWIILRWWSLFLPLTNKLYIEKEEALLLYFGLLVCDLFIDYVPSVLGRISSLMAWHDIRYNLVNETKKSNDTGVELKAEDI